MKKYNSSVMISFVVAMVFSCLMPVGLFGLLFSVFSGAKFLLGFGITGLVVGFYGTPFSWIMYSEKLKYKPILNLIVNENIWDIKEIAEQLGRKDTEVEKQLHEIMSKGYLSGYKIKNGEINTISQQQKIESKEKCTCPKCGGSMEADGVNYVCPYCDYVTKK